MKFQKFSPSVTDDTKIWCRISVLNETDRWQSGSCLEHIVCHGRKYLLQQYFLKLLSQTHLPTLHWFPNVFLQHSFWFFRKFTYGSTLQFLSNFGSNNSRGMRRAFRPAWYFFTKFRLYEANNRLSLGFGISRLHIDCLRVPVKK